MQSACSPSSASHILQLREARPKCLKHAAREGFLRYCEVHSLTTLLDIDEWPKFAVTPELKIVGRIEVPWLGSTGRSAFQCGMSHALCGLWQMWQWKVVLETSQL